MSWIKWLWNRYIDLSIPMRWLVGAGVGAVGGSGLMGFLGEYAAYSYAIYYGIRPPFEGIPYLRVAITTITFIVFLGSALVFFLIIILPKLFVIIPFIRFNLVKIIYGLKKQPHNLKNEVYFDDVRDARQSSVLFLTFFIIGTLLFIFLLSTIIGIIFPDKNFNLTTTGFLAGLITFYSSLILTARPRIVLPVIVFSVLLFFTSVIFALFNAPTYAQILRLLGYGGGIAIQTIDDTGDISDTRYLLLRTSSSLLVYDDDPKGIVEIPITSVDSIGHELGALRNDTWKLPSPISESEDMPFYGPPTQPIASKDQ